MGTPRAPQRPTYTAGRVLGLQRLLEQEARPCPSRRQTSKRRKQNTVERAGKGACAPRSVRPQIRGRDTRVCTWHAHRLEFVYVHVHTPTHAPHVGPQLPHTHKRTPAAGVGLGTQGATHLEPEHGYTGADRNAPLPSLGLWVWGRGLQPTAPGQPHGVHPVPEARPEAVSRAAAVGGWGAAPPPPAVPTLLPGLSTSWSSILAGFCYQLPQTPRTHLGSAVQERADFTSGETQA